MLYDLLYPKNMIVEMYILFLTITDDTRSYRST